MTVMKFNALPIALALSLACSARAAAQLPGEELLFDPRNNTRGALVELNTGVVPGMTVTGHGAFEGLEVKTSWSSSFGFIVGYGITHHWLIFGSVDRALPNSDGAQVIGSMILDHYDVGVRYQMHLENVRFAPYLTLAASAKQLYARQVQDTLGGLRRTTFNAREIVPGAGIQYFMTENFAIDASAKLGLGSFGRIWPEGSRREDLDSSGGNTLRVRLGVAWYPQS